MKELQAIFDQLYKQEQNKQPKKIYANNVIFSHKELRQNKYKNIIVK